MDKKSLLSVLLGCVLGAGLATWLTIGAMQDQHDTEIKQYVDKVQARDLKLESFCGGQSIGPGIRATHVQCGEKEEVCICGSPRR